ncbi:not2 not3 not5 domain-containing protein [Cyclospora cayetanensis]|uniref:Not2 not3 not5 domain-containing protein n=1 Tax=Cyclospora cayetanensis TaxID=88456 RepID=A0A1D3CY44_9EIME|nr:not2 not3 not5 domain-containing protein [Cyclospora cayetanensis]
MAEKRRLQQEVDRTLKRVEEGCDAFFELHGKFRVQQSPKIEGELKREIKKLQRFRDLIKAWQAHADIKEKAPLDEARKRIERGMEAFKQCERESKIKAFSKEGLAARQKNPGPEEKQREVLVDALQQLQREMEAHEIELEALNPRKGKRDRDREREKKRLELQIEQHKHHIDKVELVLRLWDKEELQPESIEAISSALKEYLLNSADPDYVFDASVYECITSEAPDTEADIKDSNSDTAHFSLVASLVAASCSDRPLPCDADFSSSASPSSPFFWPPWVPRGDTLPPCLHLRAPWGPSGGPQGAPSTGSGGGSLQGASGSGAPLGPPDCFPKGRFAAADSRDFFKRLQTDALFFAFYFQRGTVQQLHAAQELKAQSWRFHKKFLTWFQRLEEPRVSTDKYEQGTYIYFDYDNGWCSRVKHDFTFEYIYLEDELQE